MQDIENHMKYFIICKIVISLNFKRRLTWNIFSFLKRHYNVSIPRCSHIIVCKDSIPLVEVSLFHPLAVIRVDIRIVQSTNINILCDTFTSLRLNIDGFSNHRMLPFLEVNEIVRSAIAVVL